MSNSLVAPFPFARPAAQWLLVAIALSGCSAIEERNQTVVQSQQGTAAVQERMVQVRAADRQKAAAARELPGMWLGSKTIKLSREAQLPAAFSETILVPTHDRPSLTTIAERISKITGLSVRVSPDALLPIEALSAQRLGGAAPAATSTTTGPSSNSLPAAPLAGSIGQQMGAIAPLAAVNQGQNRGLILDQLSQYRGTPTLKEFLDQVSAKANAGWDFVDGGILISRLVTRTYQIASIPDTNDIASGINKRGSAGQSTTGSSGEAGTQVGSATSSSDVSARLSGQIDIVKGFQAAIESTLTPQLGKYAISPSGVVTITDTREVQEQMRELIAAENRTIGRQVRLRMQIVEVTSTSGSDVGIDWSWAITQATSKWNTQFFSPSGMGASVTGFGQLGVIRNGSNSDGQAFLKALATIGHVSVRKDESYTTLNNRPMSVANTENFIYPARSTSATSTTNSSTAIPGVEPGQLTTGTFLNLRTSIQPNRSVIVQFSMDASTRGETKTFESNGATLQYPLTNANQYQIYSSIVSGDTAVLASIDNTQRTSTDRSLDGKLSPLLGGGVSAASSRRVVLVLLTPQIIEGVN